MGLTDNNFRLLYLTASKSDIEYKLQLLNQKRMSLMDQSVAVARNLSNSIFQSGQNTDLYGGQTPGLLPGMDTGNPFLSGVNTDPVPTGEYETQLSIIQSQDRTIEIQVKKQDTFLEAKKTEIDSIQKLLKKNIEKDYKTFG